MFRHGNKKIFIFMALILLLTSVCSDGSFVYADMQSGGTQICGEDEELVLCDGKYCFLFDCYGNKIDRLTKYIGIYAPRLIKKDHLLSHWNKDELAVYNPERQEDVWRGRSDKFQVVIMREGFLVINRESGVRHFYDRNGYFLAEFSEKMTPAPWGISVYYMNLIHGGIVSLTGAESGEKETFWIAGDGIRPQLIENPTVKEVFRREENVTPFGDYLCVRDGKTSEIFVMDLEGNYLLEGIQDIIYDYSFSDPYYSEFFDWNNAQLLVRNVGGMCSYYDKELQLVATLPEPDDPLTIYNGTFMLGVQYPELENGSCDGFISCQGEEICPYTRKEQGILVLTEGEKRFLPVPEEEEPREFNDSYVITERMNASGNMQENVVRKITDGSEFLSSGDISDYSFNFYLGKSGLLVACYKEEDPLKGYTLYDNSFRSAYHTDKGYLSSWYGDYWYADRGIYRGLITVDGEWVWKMQYYEE